MKKKKSLITMTKWRKKRTEIDTNSDDKTYLELSCHLVFILGMSSLYPMHTYIRMQSPTFCGLRSWKNDASLYMHYTYIIFGAGS